jgi:hypothetical protein
MKVISIQKIISSSGSETVINYGSGSDFLTSYGSGSGSTCLKVTVPTVPVPQHWFRILSFDPPGSGSSHHQEKIVRKLLITTVVRLLYDFLSVKNDIDVPSKSKKQKNLGTDSRIWIRIKMPPIRTLVLSISRGAGLCNLTSFIMSSTK